MPERKPDPLPVLSLPPAAGPPALTLCGGWVYILAPGSPGPAVSLTEAEACRRLLAFDALAASLEEFVAHLLQYASLGLNEDEVAMLQRGEAALAKSKGT